MSFEKKLFEELIKMEKKPKDMNKLTKELVEVGNKYRGKRDEKSLLYTTLELMILSDTFDSTEINRYVISTIRTIEESEDNRTLFEDLANLSYLELDIVLKKTSLPIAPKCIKYKLIFLSHIENVSYLKLGNKRGSKSINGSNYGGLDPSMLYMAMSCERHLDSEIKKGLRNIGMRC